ncbi:MAG TPA: methyltransferase domain-containing protein [Pyrinomonadaceae bacterium]
MFEKRITELERIDTGDYTPAEYATFLREIAFINRYFGDRRALKKTLLRAIERDNLREFSVLDVGCGSGELLRIIAEFAEKSGRKASLTGIDLNPISSSTTRSESTGFPEIASVQGDAFQLPFAEAAFDYAISSLFFHHLTDEQIPDVLREMTRVARRGIVVIDLHRDPVTYVGYKLLCFVFRISPLVRHDGSLSIKKGFREEDFRRLAGDAGLNSHVEQILPGRVLLSTDRQLWLYNRQRPDR